MRPSLTVAVDILARAVADGVLPGWALAAGQGDEFELLEVGGLMVGGDAAAPTRPDTLFDLASLTKVVATLPVTLALLGDGTLALDTRIVERLPAFDTAPHKAQITVAHLLTHTSGLPASRPYGTQRLAETIRQKLVAEPLEDPPGTTVTYSDVGFLVLGRLLEEVTHTTLDVLLHRHVTGPLSLTDTSYGPVDRDRAAATEPRPDGTQRRGSVHDEIAAALAPPAAHAGVFATVADLASYLAAWTSPGVSSAVAELTVTSSHPGATAGTEREPDGVVGIQIPLNGYDAEMSSSPAHGRELVRSRSLAVRMAVLIVTIPLFVVAAVTVIVVFLPAQWLVVLVIGVVIGALVRLVAHFAARQEPLNGHVLEPEEDPELFAMVDRLCALVDIARPEIIASELRQSNSWVIHRPGSRPRLFITRRLRELLTPDELQAVVGHELTHIANHDALVMTIVGTPGAVLLNTRGGSIDGALIALVGAVSALGTAALSRYRELAADAGSAAITGRPSALASALLKISDSRQQIPRKDLRAAAALNSFNLVAVMPHRRHWLVKLGPFARAARTHPDLDRRVAALHRLESRQHALRP